MPIRIGANPIGWSNDDMPEIGGDTPLETCLAEAGEVGFEGMELGNKFPRQAPALRAALAPYGLACVGGWHSIAAILSLRLCHCQFLCSDPAGCAQKGTNWQMAFFIGEDDLAFAFYLRAVVPALEECEMALAKNDAGLIQRFA